jgi:hypothetical protein
VLTDTDLKALLFKSMPLSWQNAYLLKGTCISDDFQQMLSYFIQFQSITDNQRGLKVYSASQGLNNERQHKYSGTNPLWTFGDLVQFTPCLSIHGGIVSIIPRIRPLKVRITICTLWRPIVDVDIIIQQEGEVMDLDMGVVLIMFLILLAHSLPHTYNQL